MVEDVEGHVEDADIGPAMSALNVRQQRFVRAYISLGQNGFQDNSLAAQEAGYTGSNEYLRVQGHRLSHDPRVQAAILEEAKKRVCLAAAVVATPVLIDIAMNAEIAPKDRIKAALALADRGGMPAVTEHKVAVNHSVDRGRMEQLARRLAAEVGIDPAKLIGVNRAAADAIEGEFEEVRS